MNYRCTCQFPKRDKLSQFQLDITATSTDMARMIARSKCLVAGLPLPKNIKVTKLKGCD